jgi:hypothetical protein
MNLLKSIDKQDLSELKELIMAVDYRFENIETISPVYANETFCELELYIGEGYPHYFTVGADIFSKYANEYFEQEVFEYIKNDADFNQDLKQMQYEENPIVFWYREIADKRDRLECSKYFVLRFLGDLTSELIYN